MRVFKALQFKHLKSFAVHWAVPFLASMLVGLGWVFVSPLGAAPDETLHYATAYAVWHGQIGQFVVEVPSYIHSLSTEHFSGTCFAWQPNVTADCLSQDSTILPIQPIWSQFGSYFPAYYLLVGLPTLVVKGIEAIYWMRITSLAISCLLLATTWWVARVALRKNLGIFLAVSMPLGLVPMAVFLYGTVNSSSFEIAAAGLYWVCTLIILNPELGSGVSRRVPVAIWGISGVALISSRLLAPVWAALIVGAVLLISENRLRSVKRLLSDKFFLLVLSLMTLLLGVVAWWAIMHPNVYVATGHAPSSVREGIKIFFDYLVKVIPSEFLDQVAGYLGWIDTYIPWAPVLLVLGWGILLGGVVLLNPIRRVSLKFITILAMPIVTSAALSAGLWSGTGWQGRYTIPFLVGIPALLMLLLIKSIHQKEHVADTNQKVTTVSFSRLVQFSLALTFISLIISMYMNYHRYAFGANKPLLSIADASWTPPIPIWMLILMQSVGFLILFYSFRSQSSASTSSVCE